MVKRIFAITSRDLQSGYRDYMFLCIMLAPFVIAFILRLLIPSAGSIGLHIVVDESVESDFVEFFQTYGSVEIVKSEEALKNRVKDTDDIYGVIKIYDKYQIIQQGNEYIRLSEIIRYLINAYKQTDFDYPLEVKMTDMGWKLSPIKQYGADFSTIFVTVFSGMIVALVLVEDKQYNTIRAIKVAPVSKWEFTIGKCLIGFILPIIHVVGMLFILGFYTIDYLQLVILTISISMISIITGFNIGRVKDDPMSAILDMKIIVLPMLISVFGGVFLPAKWHVFLYWSPFYWAYDSMNRILLQQASWIHLGRNIIFIGVITVFVVVVERKRFVT